MFIAILVWEVLFLYRYETLWVLACKKSAKWISTYKTIDV